MAVFTFDEKVKLRNLKNGGGQPPFNPKPLEDKIQENADNITTLKNDLGDLGNQVVDINNELKQNTNGVTTLTNDLATFKADAYSKIDDNKDAIAENVKLTNQVIDGLKNRPPFKYVGDYIQGTTYVLNDLVSYQKSLYLSKKNSNTSLPTVEADWLLMDKDISHIDLTQYYDKNQVDQKLSEKQVLIDENKNKILAVETLTNGNTTKITQLETKINDVKTNVDVNSNKITQVETKVDDTINKINTVETKVNEHTTKISAIETSVQTNTNKIATVETSLNGKANNNEVVKLTGNQTIGGQKIFNGELQVSNTTLEIQPKNHDYCIRMNFDGSNVSQQNPKDVIRVHNAGRKAGITYNGFDWGFSVDNHWSVKQNLKAGALIVNGSSNFNNNKLINVGTPTAATDGANKQYVDSEIGKVQKIKRVEFADSIQGSRIVRFDIPNITFNNILSISAYEIGTNRYTLYTNVGWDSQYNKIFIANNTTSQLTFKIVVTYI